MTTQAKITRNENTLRQVSKPVTQFASISLQALVKSLWNAMAQYGGIGLSAPQLGCAMRVVVLGGKTPRYPHMPKVKKLVLINPVITPLDDNRVDDWEACLSVPNMRGLVTRYKHIAYRGYDVGGNVVTGVAYDFLARVIQHEVDHLNGRLFTHHAKLTISETQWRQLMAEQATAKVAQGADGFVGNLLADVLF